MLVELTFQHGAAGRAGGQTTRKQMVNGASKVGGVLLGSPPRIQPARWASVAGREGSEAVSTERHFWRKPQQVQRP